MCIRDRYGKDIRYCSNRKEVKDHGDTGILLGSKMKDGDRVVIICLLYTSQTGSGEKECGGVIFDVETATNEIGRLFFWHRGGLLENSYRTQERAMAIGLSLIHISFL